MFCEIKNLYKEYKNGEGAMPVEVLKGISTSIDKSQICIILGPSGSGKSTLLNIIGGLDDASQGSVNIDGLEIVGLGNRKLAEFRRDYLGFVFQFYNLIPNLTVKENVETCSFLSKNPLDIDELLDTLGMAEHKKKYPAQLSGGQQQRCSIARALAKNPKLLLCDEPTGALDTHTSKEILILLEKINKKYGTTMIIVTHNEEIKKMAHKIIRLKDGVIYQEIVQEPISAIDIQL